MNRVFFDGNTACDQGYVLLHPPALEDLAKIEGEKEGLRVVIYMPGEWETEAILNFNRDIGYWCASPIEGAPIASLAAPGQDGTHS